MCGRYLYFSEKQEIEEHYNLQSDKDELFISNLNVCPGTINPVVLQPKPDKIGIGSLRWGFIPEWADNPKLGFKMTNARTETIFEKNSFKTAILRRRCLIPANGFYEWKTLSTKQKQPYFIFHPKQKIVSFAGIYSVWKDPKINSLLWTFSILTAASKGKMADLHERVPVIIAKEAYSTWLNPQQNDEKLIQSFFDSELSNQLDYHALPKKIEEITIPDLKKS
jgi:putative SOS response-associated peptidase YedK